MYNFEKGKSLSARDEISVEGESLSTNFEKGESFFAYDETSFDDESLSAKFEKLGTGEPLFAYGNVRE